MGRDIELPDGGMPTDETDALWEDLYNCQFLSVCSALLSVNDFQSVSPRSLTLKLVYFQMLPSSFPIQRTLST